MHVHDSHLRAFADGELARESRERVQAHLATCARCADRLAALRSEVAALDARLKPLAPGPDERSRSAQALARLQTQIETKQTPFIGGFHVRKLGLSRNWQRALSGLAAVVVVGGLLAFAPIRAAASDFLSIFRLERIVILPVSLSDLERLEQASYELGHDYFPGDMDVLTEPGEPQYPETVAEASEMVGFTVRAPATHPPADEIMVSGEMVTEYKPDLEKMQELFEAAGLSPDLVPPEIDGQSFVFRMPPSVVQIWSEEDNPLVVMQMSSPTVDFPDEVDTEALGAAMLQLLGLSPEEAASFSASIDWTTTLILPLPTDEVTSEPVVVDGAEGFALTGTAPYDESEQTYTGLLWQKNGVVYLVGGIEDAGRMLEIANSLQ